MTKRIKKDISKSLGAFFSNTDEDIKEEIVEKDDSREDLEEDKENNTNLQGDPMEKPLKGQISADNYLGIEEDINTSKNANKGELGAKFIEEKDKSTDELTDLQKKLLKDKEIRDKRIQVVTEPSKYERLQKVKDDYNTSMNELINLGIDYILKELER